MSAYMLLMLSIYDVYIFRIFSLLFAFTGDSAGGNLAAATVLKLRDTSSPIKIKYQVLIYPYTQGLTVDLPSHQGNEWHTFHFLKQKAMAEFTTMYIGELQKSIFITTISPNRISTHKMQKVYKILSENYWHFRRIVCWVDFRFLIISCNMHAYAAKKYPV